ncbi:hypothetical protein [Pseudomonas sp. NPDC089534]|uniref:hypothetical protein n=1 Tax=Pseudomonas sp. NPDC089534 TaxID=3364468 RepID=UPI0037F3D12B
MSVIPVNDDTSFAAEVANTQKPVVLAFLSGNKASGREAEMLKQLAEANDSRFKLLSRDFVEGGAIEKAFDVQSAPTTLFLQIDTLVGAGTLDGLKSRINGVFGLDPAI